MKPEAIDDLVREAARDTYHPPPPTPREEIWAAIERARASEIAVPGTGAEPRPRLLHAKRPAATRLPWWGLGFAATLALGIGIGHGVANYGTERSGPESSDPATMAVTGAETPAPASPASAGTDSIEERLPSIAAPSAGRPPRAGLPLHAGRPPHADLPPHTDFAGAPDIKLMARSPRHSTPRPAVGTDDRRANSQSDARAAAFHLAALEHLGRTEYLVTAFQSDIRTGHVDPGLEGWARELLATTRLLLDSPAATEPRLEGLLRDLELVLVQIAQYPASRTPDELELIDQAILQNDVVTRLRLTVPAGPLPVRS